MGSHIAAGRSGDFVCPITACSVSFGNRNAAARHLLESHHQLDRAKKLSLNPEPDFLRPPGLMMECWECSQDFKEPEELVDHFNEHLPAEYPNVCMLQLPNGTDCSYNADAMDEMIRHILVAHYELGSECSACGDASLAHKCPVQARHLVGTRVRVRWNLSDPTTNETIGYEWFEGLVLGYDEDTDEFEILYDDGSRIKENLEMRFWRPCARLFEKGQLIN